MTQAVLVAPASLSRRLAALAYDALIQSALFFAGTALLLPLTGGEALAPGNVWYSLYLLAISLSYHVWSWTRGEQTVGMRAWRLRLKHQSGAPPNRRQAVVRYFAALLSAAAFGLGFLWIAIDRDGCAWHDRLSQTRVWSTR